ncbi:MAG: hypothetical protein LQ347_001204 [Umbilicaria vellea]|nr:MAG: hypothetical protein LQ347_001204 [Umbilicaria vellea]
MEYFRGVLILTTNRESITDPAFGSRIHFTIKYPDLDEDSRAAVWKNFIDKTTQDHGSVTEQGFARLAKRDLNRRQIKNLYPVLSFLRVIKRSPSQRRISNLSWTYFKIRWFVF